MRDSCHWGARRRSARSTALSNLWAARCGRRTPQPGQRMTHTPRGTTRQTHTCTCAPTPSQLRRCVLRDSGRQAQALGRAVCVYGVRSSRPPPKCEFAAAPRRGRVSGMRVRWRSSTRNARAACSEPYSETSRRRLSSCAAPRAPMSVLRCPAPSPPAAGEYGLHGGTTLGRCQLRRCRLTWAKPCTCTTAAGAAHDGGGATAIHLMPARARPLLYREPAPP